MRQDLWTDGISADQYATFLEEVFDAISITDANGDWPLLTSALRHAWGMLIAGTNGGQDIVQVEGKSVVQTIIHHLSDTCPCMRCIGLHKAREVELKGAVGAQATGC